MNSEEIKKITKTTVVSAIKSFTKNRGEANFQILDKIMPRERKIRSIVGGLETSLGTKLWEPLAEALAKKNGFEVVKKDLLCPSNMPSTLNNTLQNVIDDRLSNGKLYDGTQSHNAIKETCKSFKKNPINDFKKPPRGRGVDLWLAKDNVNYFFDTKTVQPNLSQLRSCLEQLLNWYAFFYARNPDGIASGRIVFPYNPFKPNNWWESTIGRGFPLEAGSEGWVENDFWDFCSGCNGTFEVIEEAFDEIHNENLISETIEELFGSH